MKEKRFSLKNQTAIITGASSGIGQAIAIGLGAAGANTVINYYHDKEGAEETLHAIEKAGGKGIIFQADISKAEEVNDLFEAAKKQYEHVDILINNAGIQKDAEFLSMSLEDWQMVIDTNLSGAFLCSQEAIRSFQHQESNRDISVAKGKIIFISSVHDVIPWAGRVNYTAAKGGLKMLMKSLAQEFAPDKIRINNISPGAIKTAINEHEWSDEEKKKGMLEKIPYGRIGDPEDIAKTAVWLVSDEADYITGTTIYVDGGMTLYPSFRED